MSFVLNNESAVVTLQDNREITIDYNQTLSIEENTRMIQDSINNIVNEIMESLSNEGINITCFLIYSSHLLCDINFIIFKIDNLKKI